MGAIDALISVHELFFSQVGKTWKGLGDLNIDLDNLSLSNAKQNSKASNSPSMNQLANSSPVKSPVGKSCLAS